MKMEIMATYGVVKVWAKAYKEIRGQQNSGQPEAEEFKAPDEKKEKRPRHQGRSNREVLLEAAKESGMILFRYCLVELVLADLN